MHRHVLHPYLSFTKPSGQGDGHLSFLHPPRNNIALAHIYYFHNQMMIT